MQLKLFLLALLSSALALPEPEAKAEDMAAIKATPFDGELSPRDEPGSLVARACNYDGCVSQSGASAGKYCGFCTQVRVKYNVNDIYQYETCLSRKDVKDERLTQCSRVNGGSGTRSCCNYGYSSACAAHWPAVSPK